MGLAFAMTGGLAFEAVGAVVGPFLIDRGFSRSEVGMVQSLNVVAMLSGGLLGGWFCDRWPRRIITMGAVIAMAALTGGLAGADVLTGALQAFARPAALVLLYFAIGVFTASSYALFMDLTHPLLGATQFSAYMGATNACESIAAFTVGRLIAAMGYPLAFLIMGVLSLPSLLVLARLPRPPGYSSGETADPGIEVKNEPGVSSA